MKINVTENDSRKKKTIYTIRTHKNASTLLKHVEIKDIKVRRHKNRNNTEALIITLAIFSYFNFACHYLANLAVLFKPKKHFTIIIITTLDV